ncbi:MAG: hypothetical protein ACD_41C00050G0001 [uncultured bacterium]|nr:MAG: hypothetical protein ACD_41C00050G0001 [uncultured bacterium]
MINQFSLKKDLTIFLSILAVVLGGIIALYLYDAKTNEVSRLAEQLFSWLIE